MNSDPESLLKQLTPRGAGSDVRSRVLAMVGPELEGRARLRWQRWCGLAIAASLVLGIVSNAWICGRQERRLAKLYGPLPIPATVVEIAKEVESVTDKRTADWLEQRLATAQRRSFSLPEHIQHIEKFLHDFVPPGRWDRREKS
jgi:hypothetical protein